MWIASRRVKACHRRMVTSTYRGSSSSPYARRPTRSAAISVVPDPQKVSSTISRRRVQSFIASATNATGLAVGCAESSSIRPARKLFTPA